MESILGTSTTTYTIWQSGVTNRLNVRNLTSEFLWLLLYIVVFWCPEIVYFSFQDDSGIFQVHFHISNMVCVLALGITLRILPLPLVLPLFSALLVLWPVRNKQTSIIKACFLWLLQSHVNVWNRVIISMIKYYGITMDDLGLDHLQSTVLDCSAEGFRVLVWTWDLPDQLSACLSALDLFDSFQCSPVIVCKECNRV